uniref:ATP-dependent Clp protease proteolytic subunit n=1 Tax=Goeppertia makoyana TaxID=1162975 RepID=UPI002E78F7B2|nr:ATP-dependent Clp protease proteolytic subunit [Goeppertia makoyana]WRI58248.1 ATP-dependent Clp protease proteolytic subunit [Goeppertia makoyana]
MPVGVPKVPFQGPEDEEASWVELYNRLHRQRILFLFEEIESEISNKIVGLMVYLSLEDPTKDLCLFINSPGGCIISGMAIYDIMQSIPPDVYTIGTGSIASMGSFVLVGGTITKRIALPHARIMIHQPASSLNRLGSEKLSLDAFEVSNFLIDIIDIYVQRTGQPYHIIYKDLERDEFMSAIEAQAHGLVDLLGIDFSKLGSF